MKPLPRVEYRPAYEDGLLMSVWNWRAYALRPGETQPVQIAIGDFRWLVALQAWAHLIRLNWKARSS